MKKECPSKSIQEAEVQFQDLKNIWKEHIPAWKFSIVMKERFQLLTKVITSISTKDEARFCSQKYLSFSLLEFTQDLAFSGSRLKLQDNQTPITEKKEVPNKNSNILNSSETEHGSAYEKKYLEVKHQTEKLKTKKEQSYALRAERNIQALL